MTCEIPEYCVIAYNRCKVYSTLAKKKELCWCLNKPPRSLKLSVWDTTWICFSASEPPWPTSMKPQCLVLRWAHPGIWPGEFLRVNKLGEEVKGAPGVHVCLWPCCHSGGCGSGKAAGSEAFKAEVLGWWPRAVGRLGENRLPPTPACHKLASSQCKRQISPKWKEGRLRLHGALFDTSVWQPLTTGFTGHGRGHRKTVGGLKREENGCRKR